MKGMVAKLKKNIAEFYQKRFEEYGHHEASLGWTKGKQFIRFYALTKNFDLNEKSILDIGCGFGDFVTFASQNKIEYSKYMGIDLVQEFVSIAHKMHGSDAKNSFAVKNFLDQEGNFDFVIASGVFGQRVEASEDENYIFIEKIISKAFNDSNEGVSFDFISDKVDYRTSVDDFHASPSRILDIAYKFSKNVTLDNSVMPFEFTLTIKKDQSFSKDKTVFNSFLNSNINFITNTSKKT